MNLISYKTAASKVSFFQSLIIFYDECSKTLELNLDYILYKVMNEYDLVLPKNLKKVNEIK